MAELLTLPPGNPPRRSYGIPLVLLTLVVLVALAGSYFALGEPRITEEAASDEAARKALQNQLLSVSPQEAGTSVIVESVAVASPGVWVVVAEMKDDIVWRALGAVRTFGPSEKVSVPLLRATKAGTEYAIILYRDDGDGKFELHGDSAYVDFDSGKRVRADFRTL